MPWPTPTDYRHAIQDARSALDDEELRQGEVSRNARGLPILWSGNFASVYRIQCRVTGRTWALKCFTRDVSARQERYRHIAAALEAARLPFAVPFVYLEQGIQIHGQWYPAVKMEWVEGQTLNRFVEDSLEKPKMLRQLLELWPKLTARLRDAGIAHADLQHGNVLLVPAPDGKLALKLIDYDGMYVSALAKTRSGEAGHPNYQHPARLLEGTYNVHVDRFSHLVIFSAVHLLVKNCGLWKRYNNDENLLFREQDFQRPEQSELFRVLWETNDPSVRALVGRLALACKQPLEEVPWLDQIVRGGQIKALAYVEQQAAAWLMAGEKVPAQAVVPAGGTTTTAPVVFPPLPFEVRGGEGGGAGPIVQRPPLPFETPEPAMAETRPIIAQGTVPETPPLGSRIRDVGKSVWGWLVVAARGLDRLLGRLVGEENAILHNFLRLVIAVPLIVGLVGAVIMLFAALGFELANKSDHTQKLTANHKERQKDNGTGEGRADAPKALDHASSETAIDAALQKQARADLEKSVKEFEDKAAAAAKAAEEAADRADGASAKVKKWVEDHQPQLAETYANGAARAANDAEVKAAEATKAAEKAEGLIKKAGAEASRTAKDSAQRAADAATDAGRIAARAGKSREDAKSLAKNAGSGSLAKSGTTTQTQTEDVRSGVSTVPQVTGSSEKVQPTKNAPTSPEDSDEMNGPDKAAFDQLVEYVNVTKFLSATAGGDNRFPLGPSTWYVREKSKLSLLRDASLFGEGKDCYLTIDREKPIWRCNLNDRKKNGNSRHLGDFFIDKDILSFKLAQPLEGPTAQFKNCALLIKAFGHEKTVCFRQCHREKPPKLRLLTESDQFQVNGCLSFCIKDVSDLPPSPELVLEGIDLNPHVDKIRVEKLNENELSITYANEAVRLSEQRAKQTEGLKKKLRITVDPDYNPKTNQIKIDITVHYDVNDLLENEGLEENGFSDANDAPKRGSRANSGAASKPKSDTPIAPRDIDRAISGPLNKLKKSQFADFDKVNRKIKGGEKGLEGECQNLEKKYNDTTARIAHAEAFAALLRAILKSETRFSLSFRVSLRLKNSGDKDKPEYTVPLGDFEDHSAAAPERE